MSELAARQPGTSEDVTLRRASLRQLAILFLRLGFTAFGGPAAHIAMMEDKVLDAINVASLAVMAVVSWHLARAGIVDVPTILLAVLCAVLLFRLRLNSALLVLAGAAAGLYRSLLT